MLDSSEFVSDEILTSGLDLKKEFTAISTNAIAKIDAPIIVPHIKVGPWANKTVARADIT